MFAVFSCYSSTCRQLLGRKLFLARFQCNVRHVVRVRFAPSPTGYLHLGGLRTALYNYLFARQNGGKFILRIEDTDQTRLIADATKSLIDTLQWLGIRIDEGPENLGGKHGPYVQSQRKDIYLKHIEVLLKNGSAYRCFCTERRLDLIRKDATRRGQIPKYDNKCRYLSETEISQHLLKGTPYCIRFKLDVNSNQRIEDLIYGNIQYSAGDIDGDPVVIKTDQYPTYHFANVVDDHLMEITHVFRGVEWQISTLKHLLIYRAFGWQPPQYGHLPLLINANGTKLSKRQGDVNINDFRMKGYFPLALLNYVISAGGGFPHIQFEKPQIYSLQELSEKFNIASVNSHPSRLNPDLLLQFNRLYLLQMIQKEETSTELIEYLQQMIKKRFPQCLNLDVSSNHIKEVLFWSIKRLAFVEDLLSPQLQFLWVKPDSYTLMHLSEDQLRALIKNLSIQEFTKNNLKDVLKTFALQHNIKFNLLMMDLRAILSGLKEGPGVIEMMEILQKPIVMGRLQSAIKAQNQLANSTTV